LDEGLALKLQNVPNRRLKPLQEATTALYAVPTTGPLNLFRSTVIDPEELAKQMAQSPLWRRFHAMTIRSELKLPRPPLPLHSGTWACYWRRENSME